MPDALDPLTLPLEGSALIEASAGTGKTWTIAALYLRLVLGEAHDVPAQAGAQPSLLDQPRPPLVPGQILVMTFTKAATRELSDRIRKRLVEAAACFRDAPSDGPAPDGVLTEGVGKEGGATAGAVASGDAFLHALRARFPGAAARAAAAWRLATAAEAMDDAAVFTIDAWCQRMLREHAFDSGCLFDEELQANESAMLAEAARDYWRQQVYPLDSSALQAALAEWKDVAALAATVRVLLDKPLPDDAGQGSLQQCIDGAAARRAAALAALKVGWVERADAMAAWLHGHWDRQDGALDKRMLGPAHGKRWLDALRQWAADASAEVLDLRTGNQRLTAGGVASAVKPGCSADIPPCFADFAALMAALPGLPDIGAAVRAHAAARVAQGLQQLKSQAGTYGFADMLQRLHDALDERLHGAKAQRLRQRILQQYPAALVDEFQDTSPLQLRIFDRLYRIADNDPAQVLLLIGDPKQSIYGFRGADIYSYLGARRATAGRHHMLGTNHRSTASLVQAVNTVFGGAERRPGAGAFRFRPMPQSLPAHGGGAGLPFEPVRAQGRPEQLVSAAGPVAAVTLCLDASARSMPDSRTLFAALCAERIVALLNDGAAGFVWPDAALQRLRPADIAVLVRTGTEADAVRRALRQRGVASVYLSDQDSVFGSAEAQDLQRLLQAVAAPRDVRLVRAALATPLLGLALSELVALASNDRLFDARCALLQELHAVWQAHGVLAMLRRALHGFALPARWLGASGRDHDGERRLTNVLHLAELLQAASAQLDGEQALLRWLAQQVAAAQAGAGSGADDAQVLRLESDADLVKVVTVHKSKGLEYPLVFLPFAAHHRSISRKNTPAVQLPPDAQGQRRLTLAPSDAELAVADDERLREDLRLLYVALTRARHALWVGAAAVQTGRGQGCSWHRSALGSLLSGDRAGTAEDMAADVQALATALQPSCTLVTVALPGAPAGAGAHECAQAGADERRDNAAGGAASNVTSKAAGEAAGDAAGEADGQGPSQAPGSLPLPPVTRLHRPDALPPLAAALPFTAQFDRLWAISSYSGLVRNLGGTGQAAALPPAAGPAVEEPPVRMLRDDEPADEDRAALAPRRATDLPWHRFPRGAFAGNFLHDLLEWLAAECFALDDSDTLQQALLRRCERQGWGHRAADALQWLRLVCRTPLPPLQAPLARLDQVLPEMEFWCPSDGLRADAVDALCRQHILPGRPRPTLAARELRGMLMGFADLVFAHGGRWWVLDYKSNALGARDADYTPAAMQAAMLQHRYDVQAAVYLLALHRLLALRLGTAYRPAQHLGGAVYLFLRGVAAPGAGCVHLPPPLALIDGLQALLADAPTATTTTAASVPSVPTVPTLPTGSSA